MINVEQSLIDKYPDFLNKPAPVRTSLLFLLKKLLREREINSFLDENRSLTGFDFIDKVLEYFDFGYSLNSKDRGNIPSSGRVLIIANHPLGALDGLSLLRMIGDVRRDVRIVANDVLANIKPISNLFLPVSILGNPTLKQDIDNIVKTLQDEQAVIIFPAGEVSRAGPTGIKDGKWNPGFLNLARKANAPLLPVFVGGKNSTIFYGISFLNRSFSMLLLAREMFKKRSEIIPIRVGEAIPFNQVDAIPVTKKEKAKLLKKHLYRIVRGRNPLFKTEKTIAHPQSRQCLKQELRISESLGETADGMNIYLIQYKHNSSVIREVGRLRETAFRYVGEGTGKKEDIDQYDQYYQHLILWDDDDLEIAGAYRLKETGNITDIKNTNLYSGTLFDYSTGMLRYFNHGIELGRSFVQPKYWGRRSLDYLWSGIGAFLRNRPHIRYLFGPVSLSNSYPKRAKDLLVYFYNKYFFDKDQLATSYAPYKIDQSIRSELDRLIPGNDYETDFKVLKEQLEFLNVRVPTLYKQYSELCEQGGVRFIDFGVDAGFNYCVDGLVLVDLQYLKEKKRNRYLSVEDIKCDVKIAERIY